MIDKITKNNHEIEYYYNIGSIHGDIRLMLSRYVYNEFCFNEVIALYERLYGKVKNLIIDTSLNRITFDIDGQDLKLQNKFSHCLYSVLSTKLSSLHDCIDLFEKENPKYQAIKDNIDLLMDENYYIAVFRVSFINHEKSTSCIIQL